MLRGCGFALASRLALDFQRIVDRLFRIGARSDSSGLTGLRDRIGALNGVMNIVAPAEGGTVLHAAIPLPLKPAGEAGQMP